MLNTMNLNVERVISDNASISDSPVDANPNSEKLWGPPTITNDHVKLNGESVNPVNEELTSSRLSSQNKSSSADGSSRTDLTAPPTTSLHSHKSNVDKSRTVLLRPHMRTPKRIIVCCDGTWQDGIEKKYR